MRALNQGQPTALLGAERDVSDLGHPAIAVWRKGIARADVDAIQVGVGGSPDIEILPGEHDPVVAAIGKGRLQLHAVQQVGRIGRGKITKTCVEPLKLANIAAAERQPVIVALILVLSVETDVGEFVRLGKRGGRASHETWVEPRMHIKVHSERANHQRMAAPVRFERDAPIGSSAAEESGSVERIHAKRILLVERQGPVSSQF